MVSAMATTVAPSPHSETVTDVAPDVSTSPDFTTAFPCSPVNNTNSTDLILQRLSDERAMQLLPVLVIFGLIFVFGILGNSLTVYIYYTKFKATWSRTAIVTLGIFDLISCLVAIPGEGVDLRYSFNYNYDVICRLSRAGATFPNVASGVMLATVAFDRYRLICLPLKSSGTRRHAWKHVLMVCAISLMVTWPAAIIYGTMTKDTGFCGVTGLECSTSDLVKDTKYPLVYNVVLALVFILAFSTMIAFYVCIGRQIHKQGEFRRMLLNVRDRRRRNTQSDLETSIVSQDQDAAGELSHNSSENHRHSVTIDKNNDDSAETKKQKKSGDSQPSSPTSPVPGSGPRRKFSRSPSILQQIRNRTPRVDSRTRKTTLMLCLISVVFVFSFLPHLAVKLIRVLDKEFLEGASTAKLIAYNLSARSYFLNSFVNVFIYGFCSFRFRREAKKVLRKMLLWKPCHRH